ncbi:MAG: aminotransferase class I/II-fold pyridoxal phosphate-dependent enzyme, partial [Acidimicrobiaceae bacterium]|nr:aminotransferase class I/II-fold pyridoxal phosphate-dependent enzyme [Acidimicrobiaceae bacterium]
PDSFFSSAAEQLRQGRDRLCTGLEAAGLSVFRPQATYFVIADAAAIGEPDGARLCRELPARCGVVGVPASVFYADADRGRSLVRFAFCKRADVLDEAARRLAKLRG